MSAGAMIFVVALAGPLLIQIVLAIILMRRSHQLPERKCVRPEVLERTADVERDARQRL